MTQEDAEEVLLAAAKARQAAKELKEKKEFWIAAIRAGARIEPGARTVELKRIDRGSFRARAGTHFRLDVR